MPLAPTLSMLALLMPLQGAFQESHKEMVTVVEGQNLDLHCTVAAATTGQNKPTLEWKNPKGFVIFFNNYRGLKDRRYKLTLYSMDSLSISLFNVTTQDEGLYTCYHYSETIQRKQVNVLAAPSQPHLETLRIRNHNKEEKIILKCSTWGTKPPPQITWLLDNGMELFGDTEHQLDGKKYNSSSILTVHTYTQRSSLTCIVRHKILKGGHLTATLHLELFKSTTALTPNSSEFSTVTLENPLAYTALDKILTVAGGNPRTPTLFPSTETSIMNFNSTTNGSDKILNVTQGKFPIWTPSTSTDAAMANSQTTGGTNLTHQGIKKNEPRVLLPVLVTALLAVLSIIVFLFVIKLWKAHREWKKENDVSEQTLESNRSKPNEDNHGLVKNGHVVPWKMSKKYVIRGSCTRMSKNSEGSQDSSVFEKHVPYIIRQTDL